MKFIMHIRSWISHHKSEIRKAIGVMTVIYFCLLAISYIVGVPKAYLASVGVTEEVESVTLAKSSIDSPVSCSWIYGDTVESSAPMLSDIKYGLFRKAVYAYPSIPLTVEEKQEGRILKCALLYDNKPADCGVYLSYDWGLPVVYAQVGSGRSEEKLGIASGRVRFSGLSSGKTYVFDGASLDVNGDGTAVAEFNVPHYGYRKGGEDSVYAIPLLEVDSGEQRGLTAVCVNRAEVK
jgi:hypothetical protein